MNILATILTPLVALGTVIGGFFVSEQSVETEYLKYRVHSLEAAIENIERAEEAQRLGASESVPTVIAFFETTLASGITSSATSFTLTSATDKDGTTLASSTYAFVIDEGSANEEIVIADCTGTACANALRGVSARTGNTEVASLQKSHRRGASVKITDAPILMLVTRILRGEAIVEFTPDSDYDLVTKTYVDQLALGTTTVAATLTDDGIAELATGTEAASSTATGGSGSPLMLHTGISTSTRYTTGKYVPITLNTGRLHEDFIPTTFTSALTLATTTINGVDPTATMVIHATGTDITYSGGNDGAYPAISIPANTLGTDGGLHISGVITDFDADDNTAGTNAPIVYVSYGGTTVCSMGPVGHATDDIENLSGSFDVYVMASSSASAQLGQCSLLVIDPTDFEVSAKASTGSASVDSTSAQDLIVGVTTNSGNDAITIGGFIVESLK